MIQNLKLYVTLSGSGKYALTSRLWTHSGKVFGASVPMEGVSSARVKKMKSIFSSIRSNFSGLNEEDWPSFDSLLEQLLSKEQDVDPAMPLALSIACARAATNGDLWKLKGPTNTFPYIVGIVAEGNSWRELMMIPKTESTIIDAYRSLDEAWKVVGEELRDKGFLKGRGPTGGWLADLGDTELLYLVNQVAKDWSMGLGLNVGGEDLWNGTAYDYSKNRGIVIDRKVGKDDQMSLISAIMEQYKIDYVEDPFRASDFMEHSKLTQKFDNVLVSGASLYGADLTRIKRAYRFRPTSCITINPRDLMTVSRLSDIYEFARNRNIRLALSRCRNETGDCWISDLSVAFAADMLKLGVTGSANTEKYSRLMEIWEETHSPRIGRTVHH